MADSFLDKRVGLHDLMDAETLRDLCATFAAYLGVPIAVYDDAGQEVVRVGGKALFCTALERVDTAHRACKEVVMQTASTPAAARISVPCFSGLQYTVFPLTYQMDPVGRAVAGPYRVESIPLDEAGLRKVALDPEESAAQMDAIPLLTEERVRKDMDFLAELMEVFLFISAKRLFTTMIHVQTLYKARDEMFKQMQSEVTSPQEREELEQLKSMF